jgi:hypothetical protein
LKSVENVVPDIRRHLYLPRNMGLSHCFFTGRMRSRCRIEIDHIRAKRIFREIAKFAGMHFNRQINPSLVE